MQAHRSDVPTRSSPRRERRLFAAGALAPAHRPCYGGHHRGPLLRTRAFHAQPDPEWHGSGVCGTCGDFIHLSQLRRIA